MNTKALRQKVLDLAIHGKLVLQNPNDESANILLEKIRAEKAEKIKKGELKADKKDSFIFTSDREFSNGKLGTKTTGFRKHYEQFADGTVKDIEDEIPFEVPEGWAWCRLPSICRKAITDGTHNSPKTYDKGDFLYLTAKNIKADKIDLTNVSYVTKEIHEEIYNRCPPELNDILLTKDGTIGEVAVNNLLKPFSLLSSVALIKPAKNIIPWFIAYVLKSNYLQNTMRQSAKGVALKRIILEQINTFLIPIPPFEEQKRIVSTIGNIFTHIEIVENNKTDLENYIKQAKSKILDLAIHGKLVPQDPNDEPAEELLKRIATSDNRPYKKFDDEEPFDIPESWAWCTLGEIYTHTTGKALKKTNNKGTLRKYITTSNLYWNSFDFTEVREMYFTDDELKKCTIKKGDLILCNGGDVGRAAIWNYDYDICYQNHVSRLRPKSNKISNKYFLYLLMIYKEQGRLNGKGVGITSLAANDLLTATVPLPSFSEQKRITDKIDSLFSMLDLINHQLQ